MIKTPYPAWKITAKKIFKARWKGWPEAEFKAYWLTGLSPLDALDKATQRRLKRGCGSDSHKEGK
jgi:hypothetical protein